MSRWQLVNDIAAAQHGLITVRQAVEAGVPESTLRLQRTNRGWQQFQPNVLRLPGLGPSSERAVAEALLSVGGRVLAARWTAAHLWGMVPASPSTIDLVVPIDRKAVRRKGVRVTRSATLRRQDARLVNGLGVTSPARTLCDLSGAVTVPFLRGLVIDARQRRLITLAEVEHACRAAGNAAGLGELRHILWELDEERCDSILEQRTRRGLYVAGFRPAKQPLPVPVGPRVLHVDVPFPEYRSGIEVDGMGSHSQRAHLEIDQRRHNLLVLARWRILRLSWWRLETDRAGFLAELRQLLA